MNKCTMTFLKGIVGLFKNNFFFYFAMISESQNSCKDTPERFCISFKLVFCYYHNKIQPRGLKQHNLKFWR